MFRKKFMEQNLPDNILKPGFSRFFALKVEEMFRQIRLPVPPSRSEITSCIFLTDGEAIMDIGSSTYKILKDEMLIVPAGQVFSFKHPDINKGYICGFHNDMLTGKYACSDLLREFDFLKVWGNPHITLNKQSAHYILQLYQRLTAEYSLNGLKNMDIIQPYLITLLCEINQAYKPVHSSKSTAGSNISRRFKELLFTNFKHMNRVSDYAALLHISPNHLNKSVKLITGKSPTKWIDETIVLEARVLLYQSNLSIGEIASELGFYDQSYFSRLFKKYEGITPQEFRKRIEKS